MMISPLGQRLWTKDLSSSCWCRQFFMKFLLFIPIALWKNSVHYEWLFEMPSSYLNMVFISLYRMPPLKWALNTWSCNTDFPTSLIPKVGSWNSNIQFSAWFTVKARKIKQIVRGMKKIADLKAYFPIFQIYNSKRLVQSSLENWQKHYFRDTHLLS
jgi:hypothetical protein